MANVARQLAELSVYFTAFLRNLTDCSSRNTNHELAHFAGSRYIRLLGPAVRFLLDVDGTSFGPCCHAAAWTPRL